MRQAQAAPLAQQLPTRSMSLVLRRVTAAQIVWQDTCSYLVQILTVTALRTPLTVARYQHVGIGRIRLSKLARAQKL